MVARDIIFSNEWLAIRDAIREIKKDLVERLIYQKDELDSAEIRGRIFALRAVLKWEEDYISTPQPN